MKLIHTERGPRCIFECKSCSKPLKIHVATQKFPCPYCGKEHSVKVAGEDISIKLTSNTTTALIATSSNGAAHDNHEHISTPNISESSQAGSKAVSPNTPTRSTNTVNHTTASSPSSSNIPSHRKHKATNAKGKVAVALTAVVLTGAMGLWWQSRASDHSAVQSTDNETSKHSDPQTSSSTASSSFAQK